VARSRRPWPGRGESRDSPRRSFSRESTPQANWEQEGVKGRVHGILFKDKLRRAADSGCHRACRERLVGHAIEPTTAGLRSSPRHPFLLNQVGQGPSRVRQSPGRPSVGVCSRSPGGRAGPARRRADPLDEVLVADADDLAESWGGWGHMAPGEGGPTRARDDRQRVRRGVSRFRVVEVGDSSAPRVVTLRSER
jgi:hypothetical protein